MAKVVRATTPTFIFQIPVRMNFDIQDTNTELEFQMTSSLSLPTPTDSDNGKFITVVNGAYALANLPVYNGGVS